MNDAPGALRWHEGIPIDTYDGEQKGMRAGCTCGWRMASALPQRTTLQETKEIWRTEHMLPLYGKDIEPLPEQLGRQLAEDLLAFHHNLPFPEIGPLEGLRAIAHIQAVTDHALPQLITLARQQSIPAQQIADALDPLDINTVLARCLRPLSPPSAAH